MKATFLIVNSPILFFCIDTHSTNSNNFQILRHKYIIGQTETQLSTNELTSIRVRVGPNLPPLLLVLAFNSKSGVLSTSWYWFLDIWRPDGHQSVRQLFALLSNSFKLVNRRRVSVGVRIRVSMAVIMVGVS